LAERFGLKYPSSISFIYQAHCGHASHCSPYSVIIYLRPATAMRRALSSHSLPFQSTESAPLSSPWPNLHGFFIFYGKTICTFVFLRKSLQNAVSKLHNIFVYPTIVAEKKFDICPCFDRKVKRLCLFFFSLFPSVSVFETWASTIPLLLNF
jgi:hypothetical protein